MSTQDQTELNQVEALAILKEKANAMGLSYGPNISLATLAQRINDAEAAAEPVSKLRKTYSFAEQQTLPVAERAEYMRERAMQLIRVEISANDPRYAQVDGAYFSISNSKLPLLAKYVLFDTPYHVPRAILNEMKKRTFTKYSKKKNRFNVELDLPRETRAFNIMELEPLTDAELAEIGRRQEAHNTLDDTVE